ncbi:alpha-1-macroglobulin-like [Anopheles aquasalis]|uniref:alpha-1-macroglobulin-like n=1 Tax=Anopheles aquasalis TaxID=42839 RepID=UPI00215AF4A5|nr:alpha-1-macroglobulin-like [Anopheles aquasalis]
MWGLRIAPICATLIFVSLAQELIVIGPNYFTSNRTYAVTIFNMKNKVVTLEASIDIGAVTLAKPKHVNVKSNGLEKVLFQIPDIHSARSGRLTIKGVNNIAYRQVVELAYRKKSYSGLIQLSKPVYKPGDSVQFRVIVLDPDLKPPSGLKITATVEDSVGNNIRKWSNAPLYNGVFEGQLDIAPSPLLGRYNIVVEENNEELVSKTFEVKEYVLSTFGVDVYPTVIPLEEHHALDLIIEANYYFGKPVIGTAMIDLYIDNDKPLLESQFKTTIINGKLQVHLPFAEHLHIEDDEAKRDVNVMVTFTEQITNRTVVQEYPIPVYKHKYRVKLEKKFMPNSYPQHKLKVEHHNGTPAEGVNLLIEDGNVSPRSFQKHILDGTSDQAGMISLPLLQTSQMIRVLHADKEMLNTEVQKGEKSVGPYISVALGPGLPSKVKLLVKCSNKMKFFTYYVLSKGNIVDAKYVSGNGKTTRNYTISEPTHSMLPRAKIIVVTVINGTMLHDSVQIEFGELANKFDLTIKDNETQVKPGSEIELVLNGLPEAYVALASYDNSLLQHGKYHDVVREDVWKLLEGSHRNDLQNLDCFGRMGLFSVPQSNNAICEANDKSARQDDSFNLFEANIQFKWRTDFRENWLWKHERIHSSGETELYATVPHTITSWYLTGFSIDPIHGFGIINKPLQFTTVQPFYIVDSLPYSVKRGEAVLLQFTLFSSLNGKYTCDVTLHNVHNQMEFIGHSRNGTHYVKPLPVAPSVGVPVSFLVKPKTLGEMIVRVTAMATLGLGHDAIEKVIRVLPESVEQIDVKTELIASNVSGKQSFEIPLDIPNEADPGSERIEFSIAPNIFTFVIPNLKNLLSVPTGCGEQNMVRFVPNVVVLDFLYATQSNTTSVTERVEELLRTGYQNQLKYRKADGSFAVWPNSQSSVFLTAFVGKSFHIASKYITVDEKHTLQAFDWLATKQQPDGRFAEVGYIIHKDMQGGLRDGIALTSYVMTAFLEYKSQSANHTAVIEKGMAYIATHIDSITDSYDLSIATYALWLNNHIKKSVALDKLKSSSTFKSNGNLRYWQRDTSQIETTAYALLSLVEAQEYTTALATAHWLFNQTYETGSFPRTQDTFVGLKALGMFSKRGSQTGNAFVINLQTDGIKKTISIVPSLNTSYSDISNSVRKLKIDVTSKDSGLLRVTYKYLLNLIDINHRFNITVEKQLVASQSAMMLEICSNFLPENPGERSNMALVEVTFPSGYVADTESNSELKRAQRIQNVEYLHGGTMVVVYYNNMGDELNCFWIKAYMRYKVALRRPAYVKVHDYYNPKHNAIHVYDIHKTEICDICPKGDCLC